MLGLFAFFYAVLHMLTWVVFVHYFEVSFMIEDVVKRPFITVGMTVFVILFALAVTSNRFAMRTLGRRWQTLHRLAYVAAIGGVIHFWWLVKADITAAAPLGGGPDGAPRHARLVGLSQASVEPRLVAARGRPVLTWLG